MLLIFFIEVQKEINIYERVHVRQLRFDKWEEHTQNHLKIGEQN